MKHARARLATLALAAVCVAGVAAPSQASAAYSYFNCISKPSGQWCDGRANGSYDGENSWDYVEGWFALGGNAQICQRVYKPSTGNWLVGDSCSAGFVAQDYGDVQCVCYDAEVRQNSGGALSINGYADSAW
jgi:hypothetical protein